MSINSGSLASLSLSCCWLNEKDQDVISYRQQVNPFALDDVDTCPSGCHGHQSENYLMSGDQMGEAEQTAGGDRCLQMFFEIPGYHFHILSL